jgi:hypothetical protein
MATLALATADRIEVVEWGEQKTLTAAADITAGTFVREDASGNWVQALATTATNAAGARLALRTVKTGEALTAMKSGTVSGFTVPQAHNASLYISDTGTLADAAGTVSVVVARVRAARANLVATVADKVVTIDCPV